VVVDRFITSCGRITLFGYDLFRRGAPPPIQLPGYADNALNPESESRRRGTGIPKFDSDAIAAMSSSSAVEAAAQAAAEAEARRLKDKERRQERNQLRRAAEALAQQDVGDGEDEGSCG